MRSINLFIRCNFLGLFLISCSNNIEPTGYQKTVVILGNSIVHHGPKPEIGWNNNWGMAASSIDKDFVHLLQNQVTDSICYKNIADFERNHEGYNFSQLDSLKYPSVLIMRIGENVSDTADFYKHYDELIKYISPKNAIITSGFWKGISNSVIERYATDNNFPFVNLTDLDKDEYKAKGQFKHEGVANHPSDKGMEAIKDRIWNVLKKYQ